MISTEAVVMIVAAFVGATLWVVSAIYGVKNAIDNLAVELRRDIDDHETRITDLENEAWPEN